jgi:hypothetical protein
LPFRKFRRFTAYTAEKSNGIRFCQQANPNTLQWPGTVLNLTNINSL